MPRTQLTSRARRARSRLGHAIRADRPDDEVDVLRLAYQAERAQGLIDAGKAELESVREQAEALVADWPPLDDDVRDEIAALLRAGGRE